MLLFNNSSHILYLNLFLDFFLNIFASLSTFPCERLPCLYSFLSTDQLGQYKGEKSSFLLTTEVQSPSSIRDRSLLITCSSFLSLAVRPFCVITARRGRGGRRLCNGDWRAEPQLLPCSEGSQSGPALPQHSLRLSIQAVWTAEGLQRQCTGLLTD